MRHPVAQKRAQRRSDQPGRPGEAVPGETGGRTQGRREAAPDVVLAIAQHRDIHGDHEGAEAGRPYTVEQTVDSGQFTRHVGLEPGVRIRLRDLFKADERRRTHDHRDVGGRGRPGQDEIAPIGHEGAEAHGGDAERRRVGLPEKLRPQGSRRRIDQHARYEPQSLEGRPCVANGEPRLGVARHIAEQRSRQVPPGGGFEVGQGQDAPGSGPRLGRIGRVRPRHGRPAHQAAQTIRSTTPDKGLPPVGRRPPWPAGYGKP